jgi:hypothetical protein
MVFWKNENEEILFKELVTLIEIPRIGEKVIYMKRKLIVEDIIHNFDEKFVTVKVKIT